ncbi:MarR family winged helix-turn-helix transcriptional regulator [Streptomyces sp. NPDC048506]|uniref:MarR family winged helix-turn-helix transcriptional regulator n=1 Tax=Streptomyces sp. NPDC048506 TaxID=3155028 RepID=UPI003417F20B
MAAGQAAVGQGLLEHVLDVVEAAEEAGEPVGVRGVAEALRIDQPRASRLVASAVAAGWVLRRADQADGRRAPLALTPAGRAVLERAHAFRRTAVERVAVDWSEEELAVFTRLFARFVDGFGGLREAD